MFMFFFDSLCWYGVFVSLWEYLDFLVGLQVGLLDWSFEGFYYLLCVMLVKFEVYIDCFDCVFVESFVGLDDILVEVLVDQIILFCDWLEKLVEKLLIFEECVWIEGFGSFDELMW